MYPQMLAARPPGSSGGSLVEACHSPNPGIACRLVWDLTHSTKVADVTTVYLDGPIRLAIRIGFVVLIAPSEPLLNDVAAGIRERHGVEVR